MNETYAQMIRAAMKAKGIKAKDLAVMVGYSYQHVRTMLCGRPIASRKLNDKLADALSLEKEHIWTIAQLEKVNRRYGRTVAVHFTANDVNAASTAWARLTDDHRTELIEIITLWKELAPDSRRTSLKVIRALSQMLDS